MKEIAKHFLQLSIAIVFCIAGGLNVRGAVSFTVTPAATSNTYSGILTLNITGLTSGQTVTVQKFLDTDGSNVVDASAFLIQQFQLTDGQASVFTNGSTSVTNFNVPGDTDGVANGSITANLYPSMDFEQMYIGKYLFVVSSPTGQYYQTNSFTVTNFPFGQTITGNVISNNIASATLPYSVVVLVTGGGNNTEPYGGVVASNNGAYSIKVPPGTYGLIGFHSNYVAGFSSAPFVTVNASATVTTNVSIVHATNTISGKIEDVNSGMGLGGMSVQLQSSDNSLIAFAFADTNGNFTAPVTAYQWKLKPNDRAMVWKGYDMFQSGLSVNTTTGSVSGLVVTAPKATAIFYGKVTDNFGNPLTDVAINSDDNNSIYDYFDGFSFTNGNYVTHAVGGVSGDAWQISYDQGGPANYIYSSSESSQNGGTNLNVGQAVKQNFVGILATNYITGNVQFNGTNVPGVGVSASATIDGQNFNTYVDTDNNGNFSLNVANTNTWSVNLNCSYGSDSLDTILGSGNYQCPGNQNVGIDNNNQTANFVIQPSSSNNNGQIFGYVWDNSGDPIVGVNVYANDGMGDTYTNVTDVNGDYAINVPNGNYTVSVDCGQLGNDGYSCPVTQNGTISGDQVELDFLVQSCNALSITTSSLPDGELNNAYYYNDSSGFQLQNNGCNAPYTWSMTPGSQSLPTGLNLSSSGIISGTPTVAGTNYFSVRVTDAINNTADQLLSIAVYPALVITNAALANATLNVSYNVQLNTTGGIGTGAFGYYIYSGSLPPGLGITLDGLITGTPTATGTYPFVVSAQDNASYPAQKSFSITVQNPSLTISTSTLTNATVGGAYTNQLQATGGTTPYTWTIAQGSQQPPSGLTLSTNGIIGGIPSTNGTFSFIVRVTDINLLTTTHSYTLVVNSKPILNKFSWITNQFSFWIDGVTDQNYTVQMSTNLVSGNWNTILITNNGVTNSFRVTDPNATNKEGLYRLLLGP